MHFYITFAKVQFSSSVRFLRLWIDACTVNLICYVLITAHAKSSEKLTHETCSDSFYEARCLLSEGTLHKSFWVTCRSSLNGSITRATSIQVAPNDSPELQIIARLQRTDTLEKMAFLEGGLLHYILLIFFSSPPQTLSSLGSTPKYLGVSQLRAGLCGYTFRSPQNSVYYLQIYLMSPLH